MKNRRLRRLRMGLQTLLGGRRQGFFTPYRYADAVEASRVYSELEVWFRRAEPAMEGVLEDIAAMAKDFEALVGPPPCPRWDQSWFPRLDGAAALAIVKRAGPGKIIEVGSGHSTRFLAHGLAWSGKEASELICIDPEPRADLHGLGKLRRRVLAESDIEDFARLGPGDVAFFDSSHILWPGTDVDMILNRILPALKPGVLVHIHDVLLPDPYPADWAWRGYTEHNGLAGWLCGGAEILWASHYARTRMDAARRPGLAGLEIPRGAYETSLWLRR